MRAGRVLTKDNSLAGVQQIICILKESFNDTRDTFVYLLCHETNQLFLNSCLSNHSIIALIIIQTNCSFCQLLIAGFTSAVRNYIKHSSNDVQSNDNKMIGTHTH